VYCGDTEAALTGTGNDYQNNAGQDVSGCP
jgi:hypothetical protein